MNITSAKYGGVDCLHQIQSKVKADKLVITANNNIIGDTAVGVLKYLDLVIDDNEFSIKEGHTFVWPKVNTNRLGIWYTNDQRNHPSIKKSLDTIYKAADGKADIVTCVWNRVTDNSFHEVVSWNKSSSHLNQLLQILQCIYTAKTMGDYKYVSFLEHDVMYGEGYFDYPEFEKGAVWTNMNYGGVNKDGWQYRGQDDEPMHQMTMHMDDAIEHFQSILGNALVTNNGMIETQTLQRKQWRAQNESIHINHGSHFTSHFNIYRKDNQYKDHPYWGNYEDYLQYQ